MNLNDLYETRDSRDAYQRDVDNSHAGMGHRSRADVTGEEEPSGVFTVVINGRPWKTGSSNEMFALASRVANKHTDKKVAVKWPTGELNAVKPHGVSEEDDKIDSRFKKTEWMPLLDAIKILKHYGATPEKYMGHDMFPYYDREGNRKYLDDISWNADNSKNVRVSLVNAAVRELKAQQQGVAEGIGGLGYEAQALITKLRRDVEERRLQPTPQAVLAAARELAGDMDFAPQLLVQQVLGKGINESDDYSAVTSAITRRIIHQHPEVVAKYGPTIVGQAIDEIAEFVGDVDEIGSSDVSGWVSQVIRSLGRFAPVRDEGVDKGSLNEFLDPQAVAQDPRLEREPAADVIFFGRMPQDFTANLVEEALEAVLPNEYPPGKAHTNNSNVFRVVSEIAKRQGAVVTTKPLSVAQKLAKTFQTYGIKCKVDPKPGLEEDEVDEGFVGNMVNKAKSMFTKPGQPAAAPAPQAAAPAPAAPAPVGPDAATQARIAAAPQGYDPNTGKPQVAVKAAPGVAQAAPGAVKPKTPVGPTPKTPEQLRQIQQAKQAAAKQAAATQASAPAAQPAATQPAQQQPTTKAPSTLDKPYDPATGKGRKYDGVTGEPTPEWQKELDKQEAAREVEYQANRQKSQAAAAERDAQNAELVRQGVRQNPSNVTNNITQTSTAPGNVKIANGDPAQVKTAMQAKIDAMKAKNPKLAAAMQAEIDALGESLAKGDVDSDGYSVDHADSGEYDYEGDQAKDQLNTIVRAARRLNGMLDDNENMPEWVQMKITNAVDYIDTAADYIESNQEPELDEGEKVGNMDADKFDAALARMKKLAGAGPLKTVYDPAKRVYRNVPVAVQPKK